MPIHLPMVLLTVEPCPQTTQNQIWFFEELVDSAASDLAIKIANLKISRIDWGNYVQGRGYRLRNKASKLVLAAGPGQQARLGANWYFFHMDVDSTTASYNKVSSYLCISMQSGFII